MNFDVQLGELDKRMLRLEQTVGALVGQLERLGPELAAIRNEASDLGTSTAETMQRIVTRIDLVNTQVWSLRDDLPTMLDEALNEALTRRGRRASDA